MSKARAKSAWSERLIYYNTNLTDDILYISRLLYRDFATNVCTFANRCDIIIYVTCHWDITKPFINKCFDCSDQSSLSFSTNLFTLVREYDRIDLYMFHDGLLSVMTCTSFHDDASLFYSSRVCTLDDGCDIIK